MFEYLSRNYFTLRPTVIPGLGVRFRDRVKDTAINSIIYPRNIGETRRNCGQFSVRLSN